MYELIHIISEMFLKLIVEMLSDKWMLYEVSYRPTWAILIGPCLLYAVPAKMR